MAGDGVLVGGFVNREHDNDILDAVMGTFCISLVVLLMLCTLMGAVALTVKVAEITIRTLAGVL